MKVYLAGPMRGIPECNFPAFFAAADRLRSEGHEVFNPAENDQKLIASQGTFTLREALGADLAWICAEADMVALLPGWTKSKGARAEYTTAVALGLPAIELGGE